MKNVKLLDERLVDLFEDVYYIKRNCEDLGYHMTISCKLKDVNRALEYQDFIDLEKDANNNTYKVFVSARDLAPGVIKLLVTKFNLNIGSYKCDRFGGTPEEAMFSKSLPDFDKSEIQEIISFDGNSVIVEFFSSQDKLSLFEVQKWHNQANSNWINCT